MHDTKYRIACPLQLQVCEVQTRQAVKEATPNCMGNALGQTNGDCQGDDANQAMRLAESGACLVLRLGS